MFNYAACPRPLRGVLVARNLTIAVALLIELSTMGQVLAEIKECPKRVCSNCQRPFSASHCDRNAEHTAVAIFPFPLRHHSTVQDVIDGDPNKAPGTTVEKVCRLGSNKDLFNKPPKSLTDPNAPGQYRGEDCICLFDEICVPGKQPAASLPGSYLTTRYDVRNVRRSLLRGRDADAQAMSPVYAPDRPSPRNYNNPGIPDFQDGSRG